MGLYDLPAIIKHIKVDTGVQKITYIGHSQGSSQIFSAMTILPTFYKENINGIIALGPVTNLENVNQGFLKILVDVHFDVVFKELGVDEVLKDSKALEEFEIFTCKNLKVLCDGLLEMIADFDIKDDDLDRFVVYVAHFPSGTSLKSLPHYIQSIRYKNFSRYGNMIPYDFSRVKDIPVALFVGEKDRMATVDDNRNFKKILEDNKLLNFYKEYEHTGHGSFFISISNIFMEDVINKVEEFSKLDIYS